MRYFPSLGILIGRKFNLGDGRYPFVLGEESFNADWVAGMFQLYQTESFRTVGGFDEKYFLYFEDVDICTKLWKSGLKVIACPSVKVVHDAQRMSRKSIRYMRWHLASMVRYFYKYWLRLPNSNNV